MTASPNVARVNDRSVAWLRRGSGAPVVLCLHGFPDSAPSLLPVADRLAAAGWTAVVPWMPGYAPSEPLPAPPHGPREVAAHLLAFLDTLGLERVSVLGHDWGAVAAYTLANLAPVRIDRVVALSVPPPRLFVRNLRHHPTQLLRSRYMLQVQVPGLSERFVGRGDFAFVEALWRRWSPGWEPPPEALAAARAALSPPGALTAALGYYRALRSPAAWAGRDIILKRLAQPTLMLSGTRDACIPSAMFGGLAAAFLGPFDLRVIEGAGHFLPLEAPDAVAAAALAHLQGEEIESV
jgi:pimeloyl-ACP methyl ester carboxylesterase